MRPARPTGRRRALFLAAVLAPGCMSPRPPFGVELADVSVWAPTPSEAQLGAEHAQAHFEQIRRELPGLNGERAEVWLVDRIAPFRWLPLNEETSGLRFELCWIDRIYVRRDAYPGALAHELVHRALRAPWNRLPAFVEEGLCEWFALRVPGPDQDGRRDRLALTAAVALGGPLELVLHGPEPGWYVVHEASFDSDLPDVRSLSAHSGWGLLFEAQEQRVTAYAIGYALVELARVRIGFDGLFALCQEAWGEGRRRLTPEELLRGIGLTGLDGLGAAWCERLSPPQFEAVAALAGKPIAEAAARAFGVEPGTPEYGEWLRARDPELRIVGRAEGVRLSVLLATPEPVGAPE